MMNKLRSLKALFAQSIPFAVNDFKRRYAGSVLGFAWAYIQTLVMVLIYWLVFEFGLRSGPVDGTVPFIVWFTCGLMPWMLISDTINSGLNCLYEYSYIVKKVVFNVDVLPLMRIITTLFVHAFFFVLILVIAVIKGFMPSLYTLQAVYYLFCAVALAAPIVFFTCSASPFFKDLPQIVSIVLQVTMWATPILWNVGILPANLLWIVNLNPVFYIVNGMRDSIIYRVPFWLHPIQSVYFWGLTAVLWVVCLKAYRRLIPHLADIM